MLVAGRRANELGIPVVFDPVGAGASHLRNETTQRILDGIKIAIIRGNLSEISFAAGFGASTKGVDSAEVDEHNDAAQVAKVVACKYGCVAAITGAVDYISDGARTVRIENGHPMLSRVTGTGCMTSALIGAFAGVGGDMLNAAVGGVSAMGIAGEMAFEAVGKNGTGSFHIAILDALSRLDGTILLERAKCHEM
jgi:hydroxyethylthiazole kinase